MVGEKTTTENQDKAKTTKNEPVHSDLTEILSDIKQHLGLILVAEAGHGKS